jgi:hypothetical protein
MYRLVLAAALATAALLAPTAAHACTIDTCWFTQPVCSRVSCEVCYFTPQGGGDCLP